MRPHVGLCAVKGCLRARKDRSWCHGHYEQWRRSGGTVTPSVPFPESPLERLLTKTEIGPVPDTRPDLGPCWIWTASTGGDGRYGMVSFHGRGRMAHRAVYMALVGPIRTDRDLDHLCRVTQCVNPEHMEMVTHRENILRGESYQAINARKTHCKRGHEFSTENTIVMLRGGRCCRACQLLRCRNRTCGLMPERCQCETPRIGLLPRRQAQHGSTTMYTKYRCRCDECRLGWNAYCQRARERRRLAEQVAA